MEIPIPERQDIYSYKFDRGLNREVTGIASATAYDIFKDATNTNLLNTGGFLNTKNIQSSNFVRYVAPGDDLQAAIDDVYKAGGGKVILKNGTYQQNKTLYGRTGVDLIGENANTTIIDFAEGANSLKYESEDLYTTGTITGIAGGVTVTGSGTSWLSEVTTNHQLFVGNTWYKIAAVTGDTTIILAEGYQGNATFPATYRAAIIPRDVDIFDLTLQNSTATGLDMTDIRGFKMGNLTLFSNNKGITIQNMSEILLDRVLINSSTSNGAEFTNGRLFNVYSLATPSNGGHGSVWNNVTTGIYEASSSNSNTTDGANFTSCSDLAVTIVEASSNGGQGFEVVSGSDGLQFANILANANTSDGLKLTATANNCKVIFSTLKNNGGYGINIANANCGSAIIGLNTITGNSSGSVNNTGTNTLIRSNQGVTDYP